ncbi:hypothetical protein [Blastomonas sp.]|uniref:hypothetical protein n=1 Tax=Blastomonas sp. TaxID=1909299 RepID=UPI0026214250|nr:hypothetical protein [Blastomonas sp.]MDM7956080.1 hypothetical protein [Blastomonas sp.]
MTLSPSSRYEFRCWPDATSRAPPLQTPLGLTVPDRRTDVYCVVPGRTDVLCKLRGGERLQIKTLLSRTLRVECWDMALDSCFPLGDDARNKASLLLDIPPDAIAPDSAAAFMQRLEQAGELRIIAMHKARRQSTIHDIKLEATLARVEQAIRWTIALEGPDADALNARVRNLGLDGLPNRSYAPWLADLARRSA